MLDDKDSFFFIQACSETARRETTRVNHASSASKQLPKRRCGDHIRQNTVFDDVVRVIRWSSKQLLGAVGRKREDMKIRTMESGWNPCKRESSKKAM